MHKNFKAVCEKAAKYGHLPRRALEFNYKPPGPARPAEVAGSTQAAPMPLSNAQRLAELNQAVKEALSGKPKT